MSQENVELVRGSFDAFARDGIEAALPRFAPDVVWYTTDRWLERAAYRGHDGLRLLSASFSENFDGFAYVVRDIRDAGDRVAALVEMTAVSRSSGMPVSQPLGLVISGFRDGTMGVRHATASWAEALAAVEPDP